MIAISPQTKIYIAVQPIDFRAGIDKLFGLCQTLFHQDPYAGHVFIFRNKRANAIKCLAYDGQGFWLCLKRLSKGQFTWWPAVNASKNNESVYSLPAKQLSILLYSGNPQHANLAPNWR